MAYNFSIRLSDSPTEWQIGNNTLWASGTYRTLQRPTFLWGDTECRKPQGCFLRSGGFRILLTDLSKINEAR